MRRLLALMLLMPIAAFSYDFKGIDVAKPTSMLDIEKTMGVECQARAVCFFDTTIAGVPAKFMGLFNEDETLGAIYVTFSPSQFDNVAGALIEKYGKPKKSEKSIVKNAMNATFEQVVLSWKDKETTMSVSKFTNKIDESSFFISNKKFDQRAKAASAANKKDL